MQTNSSLRRNQLTERYFNRQQRRTDLALCLFSKTLTCIFNCSAKLVTVQEVVSNIKISSNNTCIFLINY